MSKALTVLKVFFSLLSINSTESPPSTRVARAYVGQAFRISIREDLSDVIKSDITNHRFAIKTINNTDINAMSWIQFNSKKLEVYGFPLPGNAHTFHYKITVRNNTEALLQEIMFKLWVRANGFEEDNNYTVKYSHELILRTGRHFRYHEFMTRVNVRIEFVTKLARYCFNEKPNSIWIRAFSKELRKLTIVFVNIGYYPCDKSVYSKLKSSLVDENSNIKPQFQKALTQKFPIDTARFKFFGSCDPNMFGPEPPFEWGWLKHFVPIAMILAVVGIPVAISCVVNRRMRRNKRPVAEERRPRTLRRKNEDGTDLTSHIVHFNNRYPSMLSGSNNAKEGNAGDDGKNHNGNIPNGSPASQHLVAPKATPDRSRQAASATNSTKGKKNPFKFASKEEREKFDVRAMWDDDDDEEETPLNFPTYYTYKNSEEEEEGSMMDAVMDMNFSGIAENITRKVKGVKSLLNIQGETTTQETKPLQPTNAGPSLSTRLKGVGKSMLNVSLATNEPAMTGESAAPSLSSKLRDFGKSMLNISIGSQDEKTDAKNGSDLQKDAYKDSDECFSYYNPREYDDARTKGRGYGDARHGYGDTRRGYNNVRRGYNDARREYDVARRGYDDARRGYENAQQGYDDVWEGYDHSRPGFDDVRQSHHDAQRGYDDARRSYDLTRDGSSRYCNRRPSSASGCTSEFELAQYNSNAYQHSSTTDYHHTTQDRYDSYRPTAINEDYCAKRRSSRDNDFDEYPASLFDTPSEQSLKSDQEKSIFDVDFFDEEETIPCLTKPTPIWNHSSASKAGGGMGLNDVMYRDYTNPHQYSNGPTRDTTRTSRGKQPYKALGTGSLSSQSTLDVWDDDGLSGVTGWKQSDTKGSFFASIANSVPDLRRGMNKANIANGTKPQSKNKQKQGSSLLSDVGSSLSGEKPPVLFTLGDSDEEQQQQRFQQQRKQQQQQPERKSSLVGLIKTGVSSVLEPDSSVSKWFSGF